MDGIDFLAVQVNITGENSGVFYVEIKDGKIYFEVTNIGAADLDTPYPLQIGTNIYSYTVLDYVRECIKAKYTPYQTMLLVFVTYWYNQAANAYFGR